MDEIINVIDESLLSDRLKEYFSGSKRIQKILTADIIEVIEDLYLFYQSQYDFKTSMFDVCVIDSLKKCKEFSTYYFYLKKILEIKLEAELRDDKNIIRLNKTVIVEKFKKTASELINLPPNKSEDIYFRLGKLELINELIEDDYYTELYENVMLLLGDRLEVVTEE